MKARSALPSNYEVLSLLQELESDFIARSKTAVRIKKEEEAAGGLGSTRPKVAGGKDPTVVEISENLRTIEVEVSRSATGCTASSLTYSLYPDNTIPLSRLPTHKRPGTRRDQQADQVTRTVRHHKGRETSDR